MCGMDVSTCIWFDGRIEEAAEFYASVVPGSRIVQVERYPDDNPFPTGEPGEALLVHLTLGGVPYQLLNGGPMFPLTEAVSIVLLVDGQEELDRVWDALIADGAIHIPMGEIVERLHEVPEGAAVICRSGARSAQVVAYLRQQGMDAVNVAGGTLAWAAEGRPMTGTVA